jgi:hypothetical protein
MTNIFVDTTHLWIAGIKSKKTTLVEVVEALGPKLTSTNVQDRVAATDALASLFDALPKDFLSTNELEFIVEFLLNRLKDQHLVIPKAILCVHPIVSIPCLITSLVECYYVGRW